MTGLRDFHHSSIRVRLLLRLLAIGTLLALAGCSSGTSRTAPDAATFVVVRHAEKRSDEGGDPSLSESGQASAERLALLLRKTPPSAIYATEYRRTRQTAAPTALAHRLEVIGYQARMPAAALAQQLRHAHRRGVVLVVGHSNTVPDIVAALSGRQVPAMPEEQYGVMYRVILSDGQDAVLERTTY